MKTNYDRQLKRISEHGIDPARFREEAKEILQMLNNRGIKDFSEDVDGLAELLAVQNKNRK